MSEFKTRVAVSSGPACQAHVYASPTEVREYADFTVGYFSTAAEVATAVTEAQAGVKAQAEACTCCQCRTGLT